MSDEMCYQFVLRWFDHYGTETSKGPEKVIKGLYIGLWRTLV